MMSSKMLIDATHREETRVVVKRGSRVEEFDFETAAKKQLRGNIYLAKVTRVEPSLQAAFVDYGGNRHGFLAFSEIHPDYYQIPQADRDALLEEERGNSVEEDASYAPSKPAKPRRGRKEASSENADEAEPTNGEGLSARAAISAGLFIADDAPEEDAGTEHEEDIVDESGSDDALEEARPRSRASRKHYKIQDVIKRRQIILVQIVKEERGNKGAALTTYLSLAGRYAVLMPNTPRGGGISRKITSAADRKRLKELVSDLDVPDGMGVILRTAGANRTKVEIKRDFEYMMRLWETVRDVTLRSTASALVYEEGSLIKRSIRDLYSRDIDAVLVAGEDGYREAKDFMRMLMPSHARNVQRYTDPTPLFAAHGVEEQLDSMFEPTVRLKSGGYLVINQTEALVAIDVNSGKSTREHNIEDTAVSTNLEAADEIARQLRLRDLAGLIVCDFIDMEENRNNRAVEKRMKDALKDDRARIQVSRISHFGLLEMSRQRIRTSLLESTVEPCPHCAGTGFARSSATVALQILRQAEAQLLRHTGHHASVTLRAGTALYVLNHKRSVLAEIEGRHGRRIQFVVDESLAADAFKIGQGEVADPRDIVIASAAQPVTSFYEEDEQADLDAEAAAAAEEAAEAAELAHVKSADTSKESERSERKERTEEASDDEEEGSDGRKRRRRRRGRRSASDERSEEASPTGDPEASYAEDADSQASSSDGNGEDRDSEAGEDGEQKKRRRSRRGGRRRRGGRGTGEAGSDDVEAKQTDAGEGGADNAVAAAEPSGESDEQEQQAVVEPVSDGVEQETVAVAETALPDQLEPEAPTPAPAPSPVDAPEPVVESTMKEGAPQKQGWWQRKSFF